MKCIYCNKRTVKSYSAQLKEKDKPKSKISSLITFLMFERANKFYTNEPPIGYTLSDDILQDLKIYDKIILRKVTYCYCKSCKGEYTKVKDIIFSYHNDMRYILKKKIYKKYKFIIDIYKPCNTTLFLF
jgi:hypothetical protein